MRLLDPPSPMTAPQHYCEMNLLAVTVYLEAEDQSWEGKLAVAYNPCTRADYNHWSIRQAVLGPDELAYDDGKPYETYSCWNDDYRRQAYSRIDRLRENEKIWAECVKAACAAFWKFIPDPTGGAYFYLNVELTKTIRGGTLPGWWYSDTNPASEVKIGDHTFRRHQ